MYKLHVHMCIINQGQLVTCESTFLVPVHIMVYVRTYTCTRTRTYSELYKINWLLLDGRHMLGTCYAHVSYMEVNINCHNTRPLDQSHQRERWCIKA